MLKLQPLCSFTPVRLIVLRLAQALSLLYASQVHAGGIMLYEIASADTRLASAGWSARANDPSTLFTNPAGMTRLCGTQVETGAQAIYAHIHFEPDSKTNVCGSDGNANIWLPAGSFFGVHQLNKNISLGLGGLGYFGSDLVYNHDWAGRYYVQKALLEGLSFVPAAAYKFNDHWSIGVGVNVMYGFMKQRAAVRNTLDSLDDGYLSLHDYRFGCGGLAGILYQPNCHTRFGAQYLSPVRLAFRAKPKFANIGPKLEDLLTAVGIIGSTAKINVNVPQGVMLSAYHEFNSCWAIMGNVGWQQWSNFERAAITLADLDQTSITVKEHYKDTWHIALGTEWHFKKAWTLSGGIAYDSSAVDNAKRPLDFPVGEQWRFGTGARWAFSENLILDFSTEFQWQGNLKADVDKGPVAGHVSGTFANTYIVFINSDLIYKF